MNRQSTLAEALALIDHQIDQLETDREAIRRVMARSNPTTASSRVGRPPGEGIASRAAEVLRQHGKPMHAMTEIVPALEAQGIQVNKLGLHTALVRHRNIRREARGVYIYVPETGATAAP